MARMPESAPRRAGALRSLWPRLSLPTGVRRAVLLAAPVLVATWALVGLYAALGPSLARRLVGSRSLLLGGLLLFVMAGSGALTVLLSRGRSAQSVLLGGTGALIAGVTMTLAATATGSATLFFVSAAVSGAGFGAGFQGALRTVLPLTAPGERAGVLSVLYVIAYLSMGVPVIFAGLRVTHGTGLLVAAREYGAAILVLAGGALLAGLARRPRMPLATVAAVVPLRR